VAATRLRKISRAFFEPGGLPIVFVKKDRPAPGARAEAVFIVNYEAGNGLHSSYCRARFF
jgi:hypothetical protein